MAVGSLLGLGADPDKLRHGLAGIDFAEGPLELIIRSVMKSGISATYFNTADDEHSSPHGHDSDHEHSHASKPLAEGPQSHHHHPAHHHGHDPDPEQAHTHVHDQNDHPHHGHDHVHDHAHEHSHTHSPQDHVHNRQRPSSHREHHHHTHRRGFRDIRDMLEKSALSPNARKLAIEFFRVLGEVEATIHGSTLEEIHFHEVGARDSIADMAGVAICLDDLGVSSVHVSPIHLGSGFVRCQHGSMPVPAPATAALLAGLPVYSRPEVVGELTTPTGAAILKGVGAKPGMPEGFTFSRIGYGAGTKDFGIPNLLRGFLGAQEGRTERKRETAAILETNVDNVTGELMSHVMTELLQQGAADVTFTPLLMKKGRPGYLISVICPAESRESLENVLFRELPTLGVRHRLTERTILTREAVSLQTPYGDVRGKKISEAPGQVRLVAEFDELQRLARENNLPLRNLLPLKNQDNS